MKEEDSNRQPVLRLATNCGEIVDPDCLMYAQSTSGRSSSQRTAPLDSRSIEIARDSAQLRPYATLRKWPAVVPHRTAKDSRSANDMGFRKNLSSMHAYHHMVTAEATPNGAFTEWCMPADNSGMENSDADTRRANLNRLIESQYSGNRSAIARDYNPKEPKPQFFSDLLRKNSGKSFGEKVARKIEEAVGLLKGQLDIPNSPLLRDEARRSRLKDDLRIAIDALDREDQRKTLDFVRALQQPAKRRKAV